MVDYWQKGLLCRLDMSTIDLKLLLSFSGEDLKSCLSLMSKCKDDIFAETSAAS